MEEERKDDLEPKNFQKTKQVLHKIKSKFKKEQDTTLKNGEIGEKDVVEEGTIQELTFRQKFRARVEKTKLGGRLQTYREKTGFGYFNNPKTTEELNSRWS